MSDGINWDDLADGFAEVEAEFGGKPGAGSGVPLWAFELYQDMLKARDEAVAEQPEGNVHSVEEATQMFVDEFVSTLVKAGARVEWSGEKVGTPSELRGEATITLNGWGVWRLVMALRVAEGILEKMGPMGLMSGGLLPHLGDAVETYRLARVLATSAQAVFTNGTSVESNVVDARQGA